MKLNLIYCKNNQNIIGYDNNLLFNILKILNISEILHHMNIIKVKKIL